MASTLRLASSSWKHFVDDRTELAARGAGNVLYEVQHDLHVPNSLTKSFGNRARIIVREARRRDNLYEELVRRDLDNLSFPDREIRFEHGIEPSNGSTIGSHDDVISSALYVSENR